MHDRRHLAASVGPHVSLVGIHTRQMSAELLNPAAEPPFVYEITVEPTFHRAGMNLLYQFDYEAAAARTVVEGDETEDVAKFSLSLVLLYELSAEADLEDAALEAFGGIMGVFAAHPYLRETLQSLSVRLGLPPLTIDVLQLPVDGPANPSDRQEG